MPSVSRSMLAVVTLVALATAVPLPASPAAPPQTVGADGVPHILNPARPVEGVRTQRLEELWRAGGEDDSVFFGVIAEAVSDGAGRVYLLDQQLARVWVYSPDGKLLGTLSREGEGPGEVRQPEDLFLLADGSLGLIDRSPGRVTRVDRSGTPQPSIQLHRSGEVSGASLGVQSGRWRGGTLALCGQEQRSAEGQRQQIGFLSLFNDDGLERCRLWQHDEQAWDFAARSYVERHAYFFNVASGDLWALGPAGEIYLARERNRYAIDVYEPDGTLRRVIEREYQPPRRSSEEKQAVSRSVAMSINGERVELRTEVEDTHPCLRGLWADALGQLWVRSAHSQVEQPAGIFATCDLFDASGRYLAAVQLGLVADPLQDQLIPLDDGRFVLLRGIMAAQEAMWGGSQGAQAEVHPLEVVCLRTVP
jgi:hypothetical protein